MKTCFRRFLFVVFVMCIPQFAFATNNTAPTTPVQQPINANLDAAANAAAAAQAAAKAAADAAAVASSQSIGQGGDGYAANRTDLMNQYSAKTFVFPAPVWTQLPQTVGCIVGESKAGSVGWNFVSGSTTKQFSDPICVSIRMEENAAAMCHFATAELLRQNTFRTLFPKSDPLPSTPGIRNLSLAECEELKRPRLVMATSIAPVAAPVVAPVVLPAPTPAPVACVAPAPAKKQIVRKKKVKTDDCKRPTA